MNTTKPKPLDLQRRALAGLAIAVVGIACVGTVSAEEMDLADCALNFSCVQTYTQTTASTCTQAFNTQVSVFGDNTMNCTSEAKSIAE